MSDTVEYKCPCCGASLRFDAGTQKVVCEYCNAEFTPESLKEAIEASDSIASDAGQEWDSDIEHMSEYSCESCGAAIYTDDTTAATICPYCGNAVILKGRLSGTLKPDKIIPFKKTKQQALDALVEQCGKRKFVAKGFVDQKKLEEVKGLYVPYWIYSADVHADVTYDCTEVHGSGDDRTTYYFEAERIGDVSFDNIPVDGSEKMPDDLMESIEPFDYSQAEDFRGSYLTGYVAEKYDVDQEHARPRAMKRLEEGAAQMFETTLRSFDTIEVSSTALTVKSSEVNYVMYPVWLMNLSWRGETFRYAMNGQTGKIMGNLPVNKTKLNACTALVFLLITLGIGFGLSALSGELDAVLFIYGVIFGAIIGFGFRKAFLKPLQNVEFTYGAKDYYRDGSMSIEFEHEELVSGFNRKADYVIHLGKH